MECELWPQLYAIVVSAGRRMPKVRVRYSDALILLVLLWSGLHDRPLSWGCDPRNWKSTRVKPARLPSDSTVSRRLRSPRIMALMQFIEADLRGSAPPKLWKILDGKCLLIGRCSKDPDARAGPAGRGLGFGYKLHVIYGERLMPEVWDVRPLNVNEKKVARDLVPELQGGGYLLADSQYDSSKLHDDCRCRNHQLFAPRSSGRPSHDLRPSLPKSVSCALERDGKTPLRQEAACRSQSHRALLRSRHDLRRWTGFFAGLGPPSASSEALGLGQAPHQRRSNQIPPTTYRVNGKCS